MTDVWGTHRDIWISRLEQTVTDPLTHTPSLLSVQLWLMVPAQCQGQRPIKRVSSLSCRPFSEAKKTDQPDTGTAQSEGSYLPGATFNQWGQEPVDEFPASPLSDRVVPGSPSEGSPWY